jgi:diguanylate cyclase (GGDEF)-like protein
MLTKKDTDRTKNQFSLREEELLQFSIMPLMPNNDIELLYKQFESFRESYSVALTASGCNIWEYDMKSRTLYIPKGQIPMVSVQNSGTHFYDVPRSFIDDRIVHPTDVDDLQKMYQEIEDGMDYSGCAVRMLDAHRNYRWNRLYCHVKNDESGNRVSLVGIAQDIQREREIEWRHSKELQDRGTLMVDTISVFEFNLTKDIIYRIFSQNSFLISKKLESITELSQFVCDQMVDPEQRTLFRETFSPKAVLEQYHKGKREISLEFRRLNSLGNMGWAVLTEYLYANEDQGGDILGFCIVRDIQESKLKEQELRYKAEVDSLTKVYNRAAAIARVESYLSRYSDGLHALMIVDIDHFKKVNDTYGHVYGDAVLSEISQRLRKMFRTDDIIGRLGGDEFLIFMPNLLSENSAISRAEEICSALRSTYASGAEPCEVSVSVGIVFTRKNAGFHDLYQEADEALYQAKENGRDGFVIFETAQDVKIRHDFLDRYQETGRKAKSNFSKNLIKNISKILHSFQEPKHAVPPVLELLARQFRTQRAYIYERTNFNEPFHLAYQWFDGEELGYLKQAQIGLPTTIAEEEDPLYGQEPLCIHDIDFADESLKWVGKNLGLKSMIRSGFRLDEECYGFVGLDSIDMPHFFSKEDKKTFSTAARILEEYLFVCRSRDELKQHVVVIRDFIKDSPSVILLLEIKERRLIYCNPRAQACYPDLQEGTCCCNCADGICSDSCLFWQVNESDPERWEGFFELPFLKQGRQPGKVSWIYWSDGKKYCMLECAGDAG